MRLLAPVRPRRVRTKATTTTPSEMRTAVGEKKHSSARLACERQLHAMRATATRAASWAWGSAPGCERGSAQRSAESARREPEALSMLGVCETTRHNDRSR